MNFSISIRLFIVILVGIAFIAFVVGVSTLIYMKIYTSKINAHLGENRGTLGKPMMSPGRFSLVALGIAIVFIIFFGACNAYRASNHASINEDAIYRFNMYKQDVLGASYMSNFSKENNPGYEKIEETTSEFKYTCFLSEDEYDQMHPTFVVFVEYIGKEKFAAQGIKGLFDDGADIYSGTGTEGGEGGNLVCFTGITKDYYGAFNGTVAYYKDILSRKTEDQEIEDNADILGKFTIDFQNNSLVVE